MKKISVVIPCFNEQDNVEPAYTSIKDVLEKLSDYSWEMIFMDNDSTDMTQDRLRALCQNDKRVKAIFNMRNFGPDCNIINGYFAATGDCVVWICCDLQEPPEMIADMVQVEGFESMTGDDAFLPGLKDYFTNKLTQNIAIGADVEAELDAIDAEWEIANEAIEDAQ